MKKEKDKRPPAPNNDFQPNQSGEYQEIFDACEDDSLAEGEFVTYSQSYLRELDWQSAVRFASKRAYERGFQQGLQLCVERGRIEANKDTARTLMQMGMAVEDIRRATGLTAEEIALL